MSPDPENIHSNIKIIYIEIFYNNIKYFAHVPLVNSKHAKDGTHIFCQTFEHNFVIKSQNVRSLEKQ